MHPTLHLVVVECERAGEEEEKRGKDGLGFFILFITNCGAM